MPEKVIAPFPTDAAAEVLYADTFASTSRPMLLVVYCMDAPQTAHLIGVTKFSFEPLLLFCVANRCLKI